MRMSKTKELMDENLNLIFDEGILDEGPSNEVYLTIKKYDQFDGLSKQIINEKIDREHYTKFVIKPNYFIKGPMGKGLDLASNGIHIAFTGGTGVLPFLDLVAYLIRLNLGLVNDIQSS